MRRPINLTPYGLIPPPAEPCGDGDYLAYLGESGAGLTRQPKKKRERPEDAFHVSVRKYLEQAIAPPGCLSRDRVIWFSIESRNSGQTRKDKYGRSFNIEGQIRKSRGCVAGIPDVHLEWPGGSGWIELKATKGATTDRQDAILERLAQAGAVTAVARTLEDVELALRNWGVPFRARIAA